MKLVRPLDGHYKLWRSYVSEIELSLHLRSHINLGELSRRRLHYLDLGRLIRQAIKL